jgi:hypothetical protein
VGVAEGGARRLEVVGLAEDAAVLDGVRAAPPPRHDVVHLEADRGAADAAVVGRPLAAAAVAFLDRALHLRRDGRLPLLLLREEQVERRVEHLLVGRTGLDMRLPGPGPLQLVEEIPRNREVDAAEVGGHRFDRDGPWESRESFGAASTRFNRLNRSGRGDRNRRDDRFPRNDRSRRDLGEDFLRLLLRAVEELGQDLGPVRLGHGLREGEDARDAESAISQGFAAFGKPADESRGDLPVVGRPPGETDLPMQVVEEVRVSEGAVPSLPVERRERDEEVGHAAVLAAEEIGQVTRGGESGVVHEDTFSCEF